jgi:hypothetical protein
MERTSISKWATYYAELKQTRKSPWRLNSQGLQGCQTRHKMKGKNDMYMITTKDMHGEILAKFEFKTMSAALEYAAGYDLSTGNIRPDEITKIEIEREPTT